MYAQWIQAELAARDRSLTGPIEQVKDQPWSFVAKVPTGDGLLWFKENRAGTVYEAGLMQALYDWAPDRILPPVAIDAKRGWSLLPDGGQTMREAGHTDWEKLLSQFANQGNACFGGTRPAPTASCGAGRDFAGTRRGVGLVERALRGVGAKPGARIDSA